MGKMSFYSFLLAPTREKQNLIQPIYKGGLVAQRTKRTYTSQKPMLLPHQNSVNLSVFQQTPKQIKERIQPKRVISFQQLGDMPITTTLYTLNREPIIPKNLLNLTHRMTDLKNQNLSSLLIPTTPKSHNKP